MIKLEKIEAEIAELEQRKAMLQKVLRLRHEVAVLEAESLSESDWERFINMVIEEVSKEMALPRRAIMMRTRLEPNKTARQMVFYVGRTFRVKGEQVSLQKLAGVFGMNHASVIHGCRRIDDLMVTEVDFARRVHRVTEKCKTRLDNMSEVVKSDDDMKEHT